MFIFLSIEKFNTLTGELNDFSDVEWRGGIGNQFLELLPSSYRTKTRNITKHIKGISSYVCML